MSAISQRTVRFLVLLVWLFTITTSTAQTFSFFKTGDGEASKFPKHEVRAVWLTTIGGLDWPRSYARDAASVARQQRELTGMLETRRRLPDSNANLLISSTVCSVQVSTPCCYKCALEEQ